MQLNTAIQLDEITQQDKQQTPRHNYAVILHNDDYTPMDFVVNVLMEFFSHEFEQALTLMWQVHEEGTAICGVYRLEIAETKAVRVTQWARQHEYPLLCTYEKLE